MGSFTQADSIIPAGAQGLDRYAYVNNAPVNLTDPSGHMVSDGLNGEGGGCDRLCLDNLGSRDESNAEEDASSLADLYKTGWENFGQAWDIWTNPNASYGQRFVAGSYMSVWGGAHVTLVAGSVVILREGVIAMGAKLATNNPNATVVMIGRFTNGIDNYMTQTGEEFTYFSLGTKYNFLNRIGLAIPMNKQFMLQQMNQAKDFFVYGSEMLKPGGEGLRMEINMLFTNGYTEFGKTGGQAFFDNLFQIIP